MISRVDRRPPPRRRIIAALVGVLSPVGVHAQADTYRANGTEIRITHFAGASVQLEHLGVVVHVDPWSRGDYDVALPADLVLVTDTPTDHLDPDLIRRLRTSSTVVILPTDAEGARDPGGANRVRAVEGAQVMRNGDVRSFDLDADGTADVTIEAVAMYDIIPGEPFHAKGEGNGYIVTLGGVRVYLAGVTECTPEMQAVRDVDVAFVPMNLPNGRMPSAVAAECVRTIGPRVVYPYHYRELPIGDFVEALRGGPIEVRVRDWYPPARP